MTQGEIVEVTRIDGQWYLSAADHRRIVKSAIEAEREECAKVCDGYWRYNGSASECAAAIRARGEK